MARDRYEIEYSWELLLTNGTVAKIPQIKEHVSEADGWSFMKGGPDRVSSFSVLPTTCLAGLEYLLKEEKIREPEGIQYIQDIIESRTIKY